MHFLILLIWLLIGLEELFERPIMALLILTSAPLTSIDAATSAGVQAPNLTQLKFILIDLSISPIVIHCSTFEDQLITLI